MSIDFQQISDDFKNLDPNEPGLWPLAPKVLLFIAVFALVVAGAYYLVWKDQLESVEAAEKKELNLRDEWKSKKRLAVNLPEYRRQLDETNRQFGALLKQLPDKSEIDDLLADINKAGTGLGLQFELFKPGAEVVREFYAELPVEVKVIGGYHELGVFLTDVAKMPRIVTVKDIEIKDTEDGSLEFGAKAITYRYLDDEEVAQQRKKNKEGSKK